MSLRFLLDTNVVSEPIRPAPDPGVVDKIRRHQGSLALASVVWHELVFGVSRLTPSRRRDAIEDYLETVVAPGFPILSYDEGAADWHGRERARLASAGRPPSFSDGQIAAIAQAHGLILVTANRQHFEPFDGLRIEDWRDRR
ncbi:MAG: type II toxin-antitoxin system VapC family toxin [Acidobacteriota bacterium]